MNFTFKMNGLSLNTNENYNQKTTFNKFFSKIKTRKKNKKIEKKFENTITCSKIIQFKCLNMIYSQLKKNCIKKKF